MTIWWWKKHSRTWALTLVGRLGLVGGVVVAAADAGGGPA
jgi:hypothetical protein